MLLPGQRVAPASRPSETHRHPIPALMEASLPNRWLKEAYLASSRINSVSAEARDCWVRLVVVADDHGLFHADPQLVASRCYPLKPDARKCKQLLAELETGRLITRYSVDGKPYLRIEQWYERARSGPKYPNPPENLARNVRAANSCAQVQADESNCEQLRTPTGTPYNHDHDHDHDVVARAREAPRNRSRHTIVERPSDEHRALATKFGLDCEGELVRYHDHFTANGKRHVNEDAGFRNWLKHAQEFAGKRMNGKASPSLAERRAANIADITGRAKHERTIDADDPGTVDRAPILPTVGDLRKQVHDDVGRLPKK